MTVIFANGFAGKSVFILKGRSVRYRVVLTCAVEIVETSND